MHSGTENCEGDRDKVLIRLSDIAKTELASEDSVGGKTATIRPIIDRDYQLCSDLEKNFTRYVCGYLITKCLSVHSCEVCVGYSKDHQNLDATSYFCYFKAYDNANNDYFGNLAMPNDEFVAFVCHLETLFAENFESFVVKDSVIEHFINSFKQVDYQHPCREFPYDYMLHLYSRLRLFYTLKYVNRNFKTVQNKRKTIIWQHL